MEVLGEAASVFVGGVCREFKKRGNRRLRRHVRLWILHIRPRFRYDVPLSYRRCEDANQKRAINTLDGATYQNWLAMPPALAILPRSSHF